MSASNASLYDRSPELAALLNEAMRATLHRLRGVRGLILGWAMVGVPVSEENKLQNRLDEDLVLLGRLDWLRAMLHQPPTLERLEKGEAPSVLLAAALRLGTPEEAQETLPLITQPLASLALCLWCLARAGTDEQPLTTSWKDGSLVVSHSGKGLPSKKWVDSFAKYTLDHSTEGEVRFRADCFRHAQIQKQCSEQESSATNSGQRPLADVSNE